ncbi:MAG: chemotaxis protein CheA [Gemmatimonadaceae bacterium]
MSDSAETDDIVKDFLVESYEGLDQLDRDLVTLEHSQSDAELLARIFRCVHTVKGTCGFLGFGKLESVTHVGESLLSLLRDGELVVTPELTSALLALVDAIRQMLGSIEHTKAEGDVDYSSLIADLVRLQDATIAPPDALSAADSASVADAAPAMPAAASEPCDAPSDGRSGGVTDSSIRVDVGLLDKLMTVVGELVLARNQILQHASTVPQSTSLAAAAQRLNLLTTELQEGVMKTRMQPIGNIWSKLPRVVRDLSLTCHKQIRLDMEGRETELDKTIIEAIKDPLTHIVRNSVDHGIEQPADRLALGKPAEGRLLLRAYHEGGQVNIEISDDGCGLDPERLKRKAVEKGLISSDQAARMRDREALNLIFVAGFSTAAAVTNISGRGVGMDVVKTNIEKIGGVVDLQSTLGQGTTLKIKIPLTLAIIPALIVSCSAGRYAIPQVNLVELVRRESRDGGHGVERIHGAPVYRLRGNLLPLVFLRDELGMPGGPADALDDPLNIVVLQADGRTFGLVVDDINDTEEIVVKPLSKHLQGVSAFSGATIMGDGRVALILDTLGLAQRANVISAARERTVVATGVTVRDENHARQTLLVCGTGHGRRAAIPLSSVARLEEFQRTTMEWAGPFEAVQYRGQILPLLHLSSLLGFGPADASGASVSVVVYGDEGHRVGLVVDQILDIVEETVAIEHTAEREGVLGSAVVQKRVTDVLDIAAIVRTAAPWLLEEIPEHEVAA